MELAPPFGNRGSTTVYVKSDSLFEFELVFDQKLQKVLITVVCYNHYIKWLTCFLHVETRQNTTIEERVALLEIQVMEIEEDVSDLDQDVNFLFDEQVIQDEKLLDLEQETEVIEQNIVGTFKSSN